MDRPLPVCLPRLQFLPQVACPVQSLGVGGCLMIELGFFTASTWEAYLVCVRSLVKLVSCELWKSTPAEFSFSSLLL